MIDKLVSPSFISPFKFLITNRTMILKLYIQNLVLYPKILPCIKQTQKKKHGKDKQGRTSTIESNDPKSDEMVMANRQQPAMVGGTERPEQPAILVLRRVPFDGGGGAPDRGDVWMERQQVSPTEDRETGRTGRQRKNSRFPPRREGGYGWSHKARMIGEIF